MTDRNSSWSERSWSTASLRPAVERRETSVSQASPRSNRRGIAFVTLAGSGDVPTSGRVDTGAGIARTSSFGVANGIVEPPE
jgi:hypothetical protein